MKKSYIIAIATVFAAVALAAVFVIFKQSATINKASQNQPGNTNVGSGNPTQSITAGSETVGSTVFPPTGTTAQDNSTFTLVITTPNDRSTVTNPTVKVSGETKAAAEVVVNDNELKADSKGNFSTTITLDEGENIIAVLANDEDGNSAEKELTVTYEPSSQ